MNNNICIVGMGFVGLSMSTVIASKGFQVYGVEINDEKRSMFNQCISQFFELNVN